MKYIDIINRIVNNDLVPDIEQLTDAMHAKVYLYKGESKLIIKILLGDQREKENFRQKLYDLLYKDDTMCSIIYDIGLVDIKEVTFTYSIQSFLEGSPISEYPNDTLCKTIIDGLYSFTTRMQEASSEFTDLNIPTVHQIFEYFTNVAPECSMKEKLVSLLDNPNFSGIYSPENQYLFHGDPWFRNVLLHEECISVIDIEPTFYGPKNIQFATIISAYFLLTKILFDNNDHIDFNYLVSLWPEEVDKEQILYLMYYFPIFIGIGKEQSFVENPVSKEVYDNIMEPLHKIIRWIEHKLKK